jgi:hypothetical protein
MRRVVAAVSADRRAVPPFFEQDVGVVLVRLIATGKIESDRWPVEEHPELAYFRAALFVLIAIISIVSAF